MGFVSTSERSVIGYNSDRNRIYLIKCLNCKEEIIGNKQRLFSKCGNCELLERRGRPKNRPTWTSPERQLWNKYRHGAKDRKIDFFISEKAFSNIVHQDCHYCGASPSQRLLLNRKSDNELVYNGVDRKENSIGYADDNCVPCCWICNQAKRAYSLDEWKSMVHNWSERVDSWWQI